MVKPVSLVIAAYNEREILLEKVKNCLELEYPSDALEIIFVTDGSTDGSESLLEDLARVKVYHSAQRSGKKAAIERVIPLLSSEIIVLTDANCLLNKEAILKIVKQYDNPNVGAVAGEKQVRGKGAGESEGLYWKYESYLKRVDDRLHTVVGAAGELFSFRRELFEQLPSDTLIEDFELSVRIARKGYRVAYEPGAIAYESGSLNFKEEWKRKVRISTGGLQSVYRNLDLFNIFKFGWLSYLFVSHRALRWILVPFLLPVIYCLCWLERDSVLINFILIAQTLLYGLACMGLFYWNKNVAPKIFSVPFQFMMMNAAVYAGLFKLTLSKQSAVWEKSKRQ